MLEDPGPSLVDVHSHFLTDRYIDSARRAGVAQPDGMERWPSWTEDAHLTLMDENRVATSMLSVSTPGVGFAEGVVAQQLARHVNQFGSDLARRRPDRFGHLACVPLPDVDGACREAAYALDELGSDGIAVESNHGGVYPGDVALGPLWKLLDARRAVVLIHPTSPPNWPSVSLGRPRPMIEFLFDTARAVIDLALSGAIAAHPGISWVATHSAGVLPLVLDRVEQFRIGSRPPASPTVRDRVSGLWFDIAGTPFPHDAPAAAEAFGTEHLLFGSDYCFTPAARVAEQVKAVDQSPPAGGRSWRELTTSNARRLFPRLGT